MGIRLSEAGYEIDKRRLSVTWKPKITSPFDIEISSARRDYHDVDVDVGGGTLRIHYDSSLNLLVDPNYRQIRKELKAAQRGMSAYRKLAKAARKGAIKTRGRFTQIRTGLQAIARVLQRTGAKTIQLGARLGSLTGRAGRTAARGAAGAARTGGRVIAKVALPLESVLFLVEVLVEIADARRAAREETWPHHFHWAYIAMFTELTQHNWRASLRSRATGGYNTSTPLYPVAIKQEIDDEADAKRALRAAGTRQRISKVDLASLDWRSLLGKARVLWRYHEVQTDQFYFVQDLLRLCGRAAAIQSIVAFIEAQTYMYRSANQTLMHDGNDSWQEAAAYYRELFARVEPLTMNNRNYVDRAMEYLETADAFPPFVGLE